MGQAARAVRRPCAVAERQCGRGPRPARDRRLTHGNSRSSSMGSSKTTRPPQGQRKFLRSTFDACQSSNRASECFSHSRDPGMTKSSRQQRHSDAHTSSIEIIFPNVREPSVVEKNHVRFRVQHSTGAVKESCRIAGQKPAATQRASFRPSLPAFARHLVRLFLM